MLKKDHGQVGIARGGLHRIIKFHRRKGASQEAGVTTRNRKGRYSKKGKFGRVLFLRVGRKKGEKRV